MSNCFANMGLIHTYDHLTNQLISQSSITEFTMKIALFLWTVFRHTAYQPMKQFVSIGGLYGY